MEVMAGALAGEAMSLVGRQLGAYRIDAPLASGGMAKSTARRTRGCIGRSP
jgi:hypothetical protein